MKASTAMRSTKGCTVLVADPHSVTRSGVRAILARQKCTIVETDNGRDAVKLTAKHRPQIAILDVYLPKLNGFCTAMNILNLNTGTRVLMLTAATGDDAIERAVVNIRVHGYLCKSSDIALLPQAVAALLQGATWYDQPVREHLARHAGMPGYGQHRLEISKREEEVLQLLVERHGHKAIADMMGTSPKTVDRHRQNMMKKTREHNAFGLTQYAVRKGLVIP